MKNTEVNTGTQVRTGFNRLTHGGQEVKTRTQVRTGENVSATSEVSKAGIYTISVVSALIGLWGFACFAGGMIASGGPLSFISNWFKAVAGL